MIKKEERTINGHNYTIQEFPGMQGYLLGRKLIGVLTNDDPVTKLCALDESGELTLQLLSNTTRDDEVINQNSFDRFYTSNLKELVEVLKIIIEVNFKDFLQGEGFGNLISQPANQVKQAEQEL